MRTTRTVALVVVAVMAIASSPGQAVVSVDEGTFFVTMEGGSTNWNQLNADPSLSGGSGWNAAGVGGPWFSYPQTEKMKDTWNNEENWAAYWNQWWYDGVYDPTRYKLVDLSFSYKRLTPNDNGFAFVVVNWSTPGYGPNPNAPPLTDTAQDGTVLIGRTEIVTLDMTDDLIRPYSITGFRIPVNYNPEWVSVDVRGYNFQLTGGVIIHQCVPEPATLALLALAGLMLVRRRR